MPTPLDNDILRMDGWPKGVNNRLRETESQAADRNQFEIPASPWLRKAVNVDLTRLGQPIRRTGYTKLSEGFTHSLWSDEAIDYGLCVKDGWLTAVLGDNGIVLQPLIEVTPYLAMTYTVVNGVTYFSNTLDKGRILPGLQVVHWGMPTPGQPILSAGPGGSLFSGTYRVALTFEDAYEEEYGASEPAEVTVAANSFLNVTVPSGWPNGAVRANVYVTQTGSETFYLAASVLAPSTIGIAQTDLGRGRVLETLDMREPRAGSLLAADHGRIYIARHDTVSFTEPLRYGVTRPAQGLFIFPEDVTLLATVIDGIYVGYNGAVVFLSGADPYNVAQLAVSAQSPIPRAMVYVPGQKLGVNVRRVPVWWGMDGVMVAGLPGGQIRELTRDRLAVPRHRMGAMLVREREGMSQIVSVLRRGSEENVMAASDSVVTEIKRNCIKLN
jgi:hypothetical protein